MCRIVIIFTRKSVIRLAVLQSVLSYRGITINMRALKIVLGIVGGLLVVVALVVAALFLVDPSAYRNQLQTRASAALGRPVQLNGPITLKPSLQPSIVLHDPVIGNVEWAADPHFVAIQEASVKVRLLPLLLGRLTVLRVSLMGVDLNLEKRSSFKEEVTHHLDTGP